MSPSRWSHGTLSEMRVRAELFLRAEPAFPDLSGFSPLWRSMHCFWLALPKRERASNDENHSL